MNTPITCNTPATTPFVFHFQTDTPIRTLQIDGEIWFVAADVCAALGISRTDDGVGRLDADEKGAGLIRTRGGTQQMTIINESGLYSLVLGSRKPKAKAFKRWVTHEVLPAIRKTGQYVTGKGGQYGRGARGVDTAAWVQQERQRLVRIAEVLFPDPTEDAHGKTAAERFVQAFEDRIFYDLRVHSWDHFATADVIYLQNQIDNMKPKAAALFDERRNLEYRYTEWMTNPTVTALPRKGPDRSLQRPASDWFAHI